MAGVDAQGVEVRGPAGERFDEILTPEALELVAALHRELDPLRRLSPGEIDRILTRIEEVRD